MLHFSLLNLAKKKNAQARQVLFSEELFGKEVAKMLAAITLTAGGGT